MQYPDYYGMLGVSRDASRQEIQTAYRRLARRYHPDLNPGDARAEERFKRINEAYHVLSDASKRQTYDRLGRRYQPGPRRDEPPGSFRVNFGQDDVFSDFFRTIFGGRGMGQSYRQPIPGEDRQVTARITLEEAYHGTRLAVYTDSHNLTVTVPRGVYHGLKVRLKGEGEPGYAGGQPGDLYVIIHIERHPRFEREGDDLYTDLLVPLYTAVLGGEVPVPTLDSGELWLGIPAGTQSGQLIRLHGKGMPLLKRTGGYGHLYVRVLIQVPSKLSRREEELFKELRALRRH